MTVNKEAPPTEVFLTYIQDQIHLHPLLSDIQMFSNRIRKNSDLVPSLHALLDTVFIENKTITRPMGKLQRVRFKLVYFNPDPTEVWSVFQTIKQIIVGNDNVQETSEYTDSGIEWSMVQDTQFDAHVQNQDTVLYFFDMAIETNIQN